MRRSIIFAVALLMSACTVAWAEDPPLTLSHQGLLKNAGGSLVADGDYQLTFRLYDVATGGTPLWQETQTLPVRDGVFNAVLGKGTPLTLPFDKKYWLGAEVGGSELTPRTELTAVPYAFRAFYGGAGDSDWDIHPNGDMHSIPAGMVGIGTDTPGAKLSVVDPVTTAGVGVLCSHNHGLHVTDARADGVNIRNARGDGIEITNPGGFTGVGVRISDTTADGVNITGARAHGLSITDARANGIDITNPGAFTAVGVSVANTNDAAIRVDVTNASQAVDATQRGGGTSGRFVIVNPASVSAALVGWTNGQGPAGSFENTNVGTLANAHGLTARSSSTDAKAAGVVAVGNGTSGPGVPRAAALKINNGAITVTGETRPAGSVAFTPAAWSAVESGITNLHTHVVGNCAQVQLQNELIKSDSIILLTVESSQYGPCFAEVFSKANGSAQIYVACLGDAAPHQVRINYLIVNPVAS